MAKMTQEEMNMRTGQMRGVLRVVEGQPLIEQHTIIFSVLRSIEATMQEYGIKLPTYTEHRVSKKLADMNPNYVPCRRCEYRENVARDDMGYSSKCSVQFDCDGNRLLCSNDDGCSRGLLRKEYRKRKW